MLKNVGVWKEFLDYKFHKIHRIGASDDNKQNIIVHFRSQQFPSEIYYAREKTRTKKWFETLFDKKKNNTSM